MMASKHEALMQALTQGAQAGWMEEPSMLGGVSALTRTTTARSRS
jgi:hypothetical protein